MRHDRKNDKNMNICIMARLREVYNRAGIASTWVRCLDEKIRDVTNILTMRLEEREREKDPRRIFKKKSIERDTQNARAKDWPLLRFSGRRKKGKKEGKNEEGKKEVANSHMTCV